MQLFFISTFATAKYLLHIHSLSLDRGGDHVLDWVGVGVGGGVVKVVEAGVGEGVEGVVGEVSGGVDHVGTMAVHHGSLNLHHSRSHWTSSLFISQTSGLHILELQEESFLGLGHVLGVSHVGGGDLRSLDVIVLWSQHGVLSSLGSTEGGHEVSLGLLHLHGVLQGHSGHSRQAEDLT